MSRNVIAYCLQVQQYVLIEQLPPATPVQVRAHSLRSRCAQLKLCLVAQIFALTLTCVNAFSWLLHYFKYLHVSQVTYAKLMTKAVLTSALRTVLIAVLINYLRARALRRHP